jgi:hypothetical protein
VLVTCSQCNTESKARTAAEVVKLIRGQPRSNDLITKARKLLSGAFALIFKSVEAKKAWQEQGALEATFRASAKTTEFTLDIIVFGFLKEAINRVTPDKRLGAITSQNPFFKSSLRKIKVLKGPQTKSIKAVILRFGDLKTTNKAINLGVL